MTSFETAAVGSPALLASAPARVAPAPPAEPVIEARSLSVLFEAGGTPVHALSDVDLTVRAGEFVSLIGPVGLRQDHPAARHRRPRAADLRHRSRSTALEPARGPAGPRTTATSSRRRPSIPGAPCSGNVTLPLEISGPAPGRAAGARAGGAPARRARGLRAQVPLAALRRHAAAGLDRPRAQPSTPGLLLMDEPFGALDEITRDHLNVQLLRCWERTGKTVRLRHPLDPGGGVPLDPHRGDVAAARPHPRHHRERRCPRERDLEIRETPEFLEVAHRVRQRPAGRAQLR